MSFIDGFAHRLVGYFGPIAVYWTLEAIDGPEQEFSCPAGTLVLGGGSGEWPGLVVRDADALVARYLWDEHAGWVDTSGRRDVVRDRLRAPGAGLHFANWDVEDYVRFHRVCCTALVHTYDADLASAGFESWLEASLGEFILLCMPGLAPGLIEALSGARPEADVGFCNNILVVPAGIPVDANGGSAWEMRLKLRDDLATGNK